MRTIVLNQSNITGNQNNILTYNFPNSVIFKDASIAVSNITMYYSWFNITAVMGNNSFSYAWMIGTTLTTYTVNIPDGLYEISDLNFLLQFNMIQNGTYLIDANGNNVYFAEFILNPTRYAVQINTYYIPTSLPAGYTQPSNFVGYPTTSQNVIVTLPPLFNAIMGYVANFTTDANSGGSFTPPANSQYVSKNAANTISYISTVAPNVQPNSTIVLFK